MIVRRTLPPTPRLFGRRGFLTSTGATLLYAALAPAASPRTAAAQGLGDYPFTLGIASGDPTADGVVLWTRLAPRPFDGGGMPARPMAVQWQVATDERMDAIVQRGATLATPELGHSVHVEVNGLEPSRCTGISSRSATTCPRAPPRGLAGRRWSRTWGAGGVGRVAMGRVAAIRVDTARPDRRWRRTRRAVRHRTARRVSARLAGITSGSAQRPAARMRLRIAAADDGCAFRVTAASAWP